MRDFLQILKQFELYREEDHNKSSSEYRLYGNLVEFISLDMPQKVRGRKRNLLFINEANELNFEEEVYSSTGLKHEDLIESIK